MAFKSMTGYGNGEAFSAGIKIDVELSAVNRKQFDVRLNMPRQMSGMESRIRELVNATVSRGYVTGVVRVDYDGSKKGNSVVVNMKLAESYLIAMRQASGKLGLKDDLSARLLMSMPDVIRHEDVLEDSEKIWNLTKKAVKMALVHLLAMRQTEGVALSKDLIKRLRSMRTRLDAIEKVHPAAVAKRLKLLRARIKTAGIDVSGSREMIAREMVLYADRCDISEEIVRLKSHFSHMDKLMKSDAPVGRALDFLCQEMLREINTIGSKGNDKVISQNVIKLKTELECVREQVQNVE